MRPFHLGDNGSRGSNRILRFQDRPADHDVIDTGFDGVGGRRHSLLIVAGAVSGADTGGEALGSLGQAIAAQLLGPGAAAPVRVAILPEP